jgi:hypothetical protein
MNEQSFVSVHCFYKSRGSLLSIVSDCRLDDRGSIPGRGKMIFPLASVSRSALSLLWNVYRGSFPGG